MSRKLDRRSLQSCLFQLTTLVNAIRFFNGTAVPDFEGNKGKIAAYAKYCHECLNPGLGDAWSPLKEDGSVSLYDKDGEKLINISHEATMEVTFSDEFIATWWELIRDYVKDQKNTESRLALLSGHYLDHIFRIADITTIVNKAGNRPLRISPSTIAAVRAAQEQL